MLTFATWKDGFALEQDSRRLDPIYYYVKNGDLKKAMPFEIEPLYEDEDAANPVIAVIERSSQQIEVMALADEVLMYSRVVSTLAKRYRAWKTVTLKVKGTQAWEVDSQLTPLMQQLGFSRQSISLGAIVWTRP